MTSGAADEPTLDETTSPEHAMPTRIARFRIVDRLAVGGAGTVYAAYDPKQARTVALKVSSTGDEDRWRREAEARAKISHPNVVPFLDAGVDQGRAYIAMTLVSGGDLRSVLRRRRLSIAEILELFVGLGRGLQAVHDAGLLHLDVKPHNVLVAPDSQPLLTDFGLARAPGESSESTRTGRRLGTPRYMSPEQISGRPLTAASDQFSFGVALYEALFCRHPFVHTDTPSLHAAVLAGRVVVPTERRVSNRVREAVLRCLSSDPSARFGSMQDVVQALEAKGRGTTHIVAMAVCAAAGLVAAAFIPGG